MALLLVDTSTARCAVLVRNNGSGFSDLELGSRGQDARLAPMVHEVLAEAKLTPQGIAQIGVVVGPGAFTGVRIGVSFARGLGLALDVPVIGINALDVFALSTGDHEYCAGICDIGRGELAYRLCKDGMLLGGYETAPIETVLSRLRSFGQGKTVYLAGSAAHLADQSILVNSGLHDLDLTRVADLIEAGALPKLDAMPWYHRAPDAKLPSGITP